MAQRGGAQGPPVGQSQTQQKINVTPPVANYKFLKSFRGFKVDQDQNGLIPIQAIWIVDPTTGNPVQIAAIGSGVNQILALEISPVDLAITPSTTVALGATSPIQSARL